MSYPPQLDYYCQRLEGLSVGLFRLEPQGAATGLTAGQILRFTLPSNALCDVRSFCLRFNATCVDDGGTICSRLPNRIESLIAKVEVSIGGVQISSGTSFYNTLLHAKSCLDGWADDAGKNHPEIIQSLALNNYVDNTLLGNAEGSALRSPYSIDKWLGFLGECEPRVIDSGLVGDIVVQITLEQPNLCITSSDSNTDGNFVQNAGANPAQSYSLGELYATIRCYSLPSGVYDNLLAEQMASAGSLEVGFKNYFAFRDSVTNVLRWQCASQSINRVFVAHHGEHNANPSTTRRHPVLITGYLQESTAAPNRNLEMGKIKYKHPYSVYPCPAPVAQVEFDWTINGAKFPQYKMTPQDTLQVTRLSGEKGDMSFPNVGLVEYKDSQFVSALKLTMDTPNARFIQGLDSRSVAISGFYNMYNATPAVTLTLFVECASSLLISSGRQIAVVI